MRTTFFIEKYVKPGSKEAMLFFRIQRRSTKLDMQISTQTAVNIDKWEEAHKDLASLEKFERSKYGRDILDRCDKAVSVASALIDAGITERKAIKNAIFNAVNADKLEAARQEEEILSRKKKEKEAAERHQAEANADDVLLCCREFVQGVKDGTIKYFKKEQMIRYSEGSCKKWGSFCELLAKYYALHPFTWKDIDDKFYINWMRFLESNGYMKMSIGKFNTCLKHLIIYYKGKDEAKAIHKTFNIDTDEKAAEIYLTSDEVQALYEMPLTGLKEKIRDVFLIGVYTAQRFSDYSRIKKENFGVTARGTKVVRLTQKKTGTKVVIPILNDNLQRLCEKYNGDIPTINAQVLNRYIKAIGKELSSTVKSLAEMVPTKLTMKEREAEKQEQKKIVFIRDEEGRVLRPRYECINSHTARRTGITLMYLTGKYTTVQMMAVSGHTKEDIFRNYIKLTLDEKADEVANAANEDGLF